MSTMVDRVGRAILDEAKNFGPLAHHMGDVFERRLARAAIEALMEPTDAMLDAVADEEDRRGIPSGVIGALIAEEAWPLMIQAALKEQA
ncbi:hypothetical protein [Sinorhizobium meliloti]|uniref:hypothetical protein n=1 Tax=Rhizobium meliloti TaxID=382 RepID=UPI000FDB065F|nr:hypothetical protein [Sinorhizobium meliloti]RVG88689.1 hypothetical protein CN219_03725 [Sinorhizobium meliloti]RVI39029.1 hypothetical protein CN197_02510 [Sinorhizobium meliloti]RVI46664.1 hypothetical protein CN196_09360 [Sinorhizobium meliloti]RVJ25666.1 hypothetical protein CN177_13400 [Sinorhizobium meliloti]RVK02255.1 hypothetical protein CN170_08730 [Sinorhizobium meliloti]